MSAGETEKLLNACKFEKIEEIKFYLKNNVNALGIGKDGHSPLGIACQTGNLEIVRLLLNALKEKAPRPKANSPGYFPLFVHDNYEQQQQQQQQQLEDLLHVPMTSVDDPWEDAFTPEDMDNLEWDTEIDDNSLLTNDMSTKYDDDPISKMYKWYASILSTTAELLTDHKKNNDINAIDRFGFAAIHYASREGHVDIIELLLNHGSRVNVESSKGLTPLLIATFKGRTAAVHKLLESGSNPNAVTTHQMSALHIAANNGFGKVAQLLLNYNADKNACDLKDTTPLNLAVLNGHYEMTKLLIESDAKVNLANVLGHTPLFLALSKGDYPITKLLLKNGAKVRPDQLLLHEALHGFNPKLVKLIAPVVPFTDQMDREGNTPLMLAIIKYYPMDTLKILLENGANAEVKITWSNSNILETTARAIDRPCAYFISLINLFCEFRYEPSINFFYTALRMQNRHALLSYTRLYGLPPLLKYDIEQLLSNYDCNQIAILTAAGIRSNYHLHHQQVATLFDLTRTVVRKRLVGNIAEKCRQLPLPLSLILKLQLHDCPCSCETH